MSNENQSEAVSAPIPILVTPSEKELIIQAATEDDRSVSSWCRRHLVKEAQDQLESLKA